MSTSKIALVTGAAGGIGRELVAGLRSAGWTVATTDLPDAGSAPDSDVPVSDVPVSDVPDSDLAVPADLRDRDTCHRVVDAVLAEFGRLDLLVNNAATMTVVEPTVETMGLWWRDIEVNLTAPLWLTQAAETALAAVNGQVINITSISGLRGEPGFSAYAASKAGLLGMTRSLARELAPAIRVNAVAPGPTDTAQLGRDAEFGGISLDELRARYAAEMPIGRLVAPAEVAEVVVFLSGSEAITGECVQINGGMLMA